MGTAGSELCQDRTVADLDFNRLLRFMRDLHEQAQPVEYCEDAAPIPLTGAGG